MKIALISRVFSKNMKESTNITLIDFATELKKHGHDVAIFAEGRMGFPDEEEFKGIKIFRDFYFLRVHCGIWLTTSWSIPRAMKKQKAKGFKPDIVHSFSSAPIFATYAIYAKKMFNCGAIHTIKSKSNSWIGNQFHKILNKVDRITVATEKQRRELIKKGVKESKIKLIHSHINVQKFKPLNKTALKKKYGYTGKKVVLYYGAMRDDKGTWDLFQSMQRVIENVPDVIYIYICRFKEIEVKYTESPNVKIITDDVNIEEYVNLADLAIFPYRTLTRTESNPSCVLESLACKTPVITSNLEELNEILQDNHDCLMVQPHNPEQLADRTIWALNNPKQLKTLAENGFKTAQKFDVRKVAKEFVKVYEGIKRT